MALLQINRNPSSKELRQFAGIWFPLFFLVIGVLVARHWDLWNVVIPVWVAVAVVSLVGVIKPMFMKPIFIGWMTAAFPIGWVVSHVILGITYYLVITPIGLAMRLVGRDPMERRIDKHVTTYWKAHKPAENRQRYFRQF